MNNPKFENIRDSRPEHTKYDNTKVQTLALNPPHGIDFEDFHPIWHREQPIGIDFADSHPIWHLEQPLGIDFADSYPKKDI